MGEECQELLVEDNPNVEVNGLWDIATRQGLQLFLCLQAPLEKWGEPGRIGDIGGNRATPRFEESGYKIGLSLGRNRTQLFKDEVASALVSLALA